MAEATPLEIDATNVVTDPPVGRSPSVLDRIQRAVLHRTGDSLAKVLIIALLLSAVSSAFVLAAVVRVEGLSALDEYTHLDWVYRVQHGEIPADGDLADDKVLADWACIGQWNVQNMPPCGAPVDAEEFPHGGQQYNSFHPPLYYAITAGLVRVGELFVGDQYFVALARMTGALWLASAMVLLYVACRVWRIGTVLAIAAPLLMLTLPQILTSATFVTNDAPAALAGAYAVYYLGRFRIARAVNLIVPSVLTLLFSATKTLNALPMLVIAAGLGCWGLLALARRQRLTGWHRLRASIALALPSAVLFFVWGQIQRARAMPDWVNPVLGVNTRDLVLDPLTSWVPTLASGFNLTGELFLTPELQSNYISGWNTGISVPLAAAALLALVLYRRGSRRRWPAMLLLAGCALFPLLVQLQALRLGVQPQFFLYLSRRYGISLLPLAIFCLAMVADTRNLRKTSIGIVGTGLVIAGGSAFGYLVR